MCTCHVMYRHGASEVSAKDVPHVHVSRGPPQRSHGRTMPVWTTLPITNTSCITRVLNSPEIVLSPISPIHEQSPNHYTMSVSAPPVSPPPFSPRGRAFCESWPQAPEVLSSVMGRPTLLHVRLGLGDEFFERCLLQELFGHLVRPRPGGPPQSWSPCAATAGIAATKGIAAAPRTGDYRRTGKSLVLL